MDSGLKLWGIMTTSVIVLSNDNPTLVKIAARLAKVAFGDRIQICDGSDDDAQIQAALDALPAVGGTIYLTEGTFNSSFLTLPAKPVNIIGAGIGITTIKLNTDTAWLIYWSDGQGGSIQDLTLDGDKATRGAGGACYGRPYKYLINRVEFLNWTSNGIRFANIGPTDAEIDIIASYFQGMEEAAIYDEPTAPVSGIDIVTCWFYENHSDFYGLGHFIHFIDNTFASATGDSSIHLMGHSSHIKLVDNRFQDCYGGLLLWDLGASVAEDILISGNTVYECATIGAASFAVIQVTKTTGSLKHIQIVNNIICDPVASNSFTYFILAVGVDDLKVEGNDIGAGIYSAGIAACISHDATVFNIFGNIGYLYAGEPRTASGSLVAGNVNAISLAWNNPEAQDVLIKKVVVEVTTPGGVGGSHLDVGIADDAAGTNRGTEFFDDLLLNSVQINDSWVAGDGGTQTKWVFCEDHASATDDWIVGQILDANAGALVGKYYIEYVGR